ncbi:MAG: hypothetical protein OEY00_04555 [Gammaproteobacteria bacterium]|nr:hypothetical protein [Gammaproteobacteria bacterium]
MKHQNKLNAGLFSFIKPALSLIAAFMLLSLTACGGGGGGGGVADTGDGGGNGGDDAPTVDETPFLNLTNFQTASVVIGQANFTDNTGNQGGVDANTFSSPEGNPGVVNGILYLPDSENNRLLGFNSIPTANNANADFVVGQDEFTTNSAGVGTTHLRFRFPRAVAFDGGKMFMVESENNRLLIWNSIPAGNVAADVVLGQDDFISGGVGDCDNKGLAGPTGVSAVNGKLIVADNGNNRVLIWNSIPTTNNAPADIVLGQNSFTRCRQNDDNQDGAPDIVDTIEVASARTLADPSEVWSDGTRLVVADGLNQRVLIWNSFPTANFTPADVVLGQGDFTHRSRNDDNQDGAPDIVDTKEVASARTLGAFNTEVYSNGQQLFVADTHNNRVLVWNSFPTENFTPADVVLGQGDFTHKTRNDLDQDGTDDGQASAQTLHAPSGLFQSGNQLIVTDTGNHRYLIFNGQ